MIRSCKTFCGGTTLILVLSLSTANSNLRYELRSVFSYSLVETIGFGKRSQIFNRGWVHAVRLLRWRFDDQSQLSKEMPIVWPTTDKIQAPVADQTTNFIKNLTIEHQSVFIIIMQTTNKGFKEKETKVLNILCSTKKSSAANKLSLLASLAVSLSKSKTKHFL